MGMLRFAVSAILMLASPLESSWTYLRVYHVSTEVIFTEQFVAVPAFDDLCTRLLPMCRLRPADKPRGL